MLGQDYANKIAYAGDVASDVQQGGLVRLANQIAEATGRVDQIAGNLNSISVGIHGPRPEPVSAGEASGKPNADSFSARVSSLMASIDRLQRSYESIVR